MNQYFAAFVLGALLTWGLTSIHYTEQITELHTKIDTADEQAQRDKLKGEANGKEIERAHADRIAAITRYYKRMLQLVPTQAGASSAASGAKAIDGAASEQGASGCSIEFESRCVRDAATVTGFQEYVIRNGIPVSE